MQSGFEGDAKRLKPYLCNLISKNQNAFVPRKVIQDSIIIAHEVFHAMRTKKLGKEGVMTIKLDTLKAYDRVEWDFLQEVMERIGFCKKWIDWVMECVQTMSYSILINREATKTFYLLRGL